MALEGRHIKYVVFEYYKCLFILLSVGSNFFVIFKFYVELSGHLSTLIIINNLNCWQKTNSLSTILHISLMD